MARSDYVARAQIGRMAEHVLDSAPSPSRPRVSVARPVATTEMERRLEAFLLIARRVGLS